MDWLPLESATYWIVFVGGFLAVAVWESLSPRRATALPAEKRWSRHAILLVASAVSNTLLLRVTPVFVALWAAANPYGLLNSASLPYPLQFAAALVLLDGAGYAAHRLVHSVPWLWRLHEVHHSDADYDVSTAWRFHPLDGTLRQGLYLASVALLSAPPAAVFLSELLVAGGNVFVHANSSLPERVERALRRVMITPQLHRIHHSEDGSEQNRNFGQFFCCWDQLWGTYQSTPRRGSGLATGIAGIGGGEALAVAYLLFSPFTSRKRVPAAKHGTLP